MTYGAHLRGSAADIGVGYNTVLKTAYPARHTTKKQGHLPSRFAQMRSY